MYEYSFSFLLKAIALCEFPAPEMSLITLITYLYQ